MPPTMAPEFVMVRPARVEDAAAIVDYNMRLAFETEEKRLDPEVVTPGVEAVLHDPRHGRYFVAIVDNRLVGQTMVTEEWSDWRNGRIWWLQSVYVEAPWRGRGVFGRLLAHVQKVARDEGVVGLRLYVENENRRALQTYLHRGFVDAGYRVLEQIPVPPPGSARS